MKKIIAVALAVSLLLSFGMVASADSDELKFNSDGKFTILNLSDTQDDQYPAYDMVNFVKLAIDETNPDLIVFSGDIVEDNRAGDIGSDDQILKEGVVVAKRHIHATTKDAAE